MAKLSASEIQALRDVLLDAYDRASFEDLLELRLDKRLEHIAPSGGTLPNAVVSVIKAAEAQHWTADLLRAASAERPSLVYLQDTVRKLLIRVAAPEERPDCPYPGMVPFTTADARFFYGREAEIEAMLRHLRNQRLLFVIGASGSGKSSLINAGLLPRLDPDSNEGSKLFPRGYWLVRKMRPGADPMGALREALGGDPARPEQAVAAHPPAQRLLLVVDQLEETFTDQLTSEARRDFIAAILALQGVEACTLLIAMRADFYPDLMNSDLWPVDAGQRLEVTALRGAALRAAIVEPARQRDVAVEDALAERLLADAAGEPGVLPMLQETLVLLWAAMTDRRLTLDAYEKLGESGRSGLAVAIATKADAVYAGLSPEGQAAARRIFLRLIQFGEGREDTRRQQPEGALRSATDNPEAFASVVDELAASRLLTLSGGEEGDEPRADISHEALIAGWPRLQKWADERRVAEQTRRRLEEKAAEWARLGRGGGGMLDATELPEAERWLASADADELGRSDDLRRLAEASRTAIRRRQRLQIAAMIALVGLTVAAVVFGFQSRANANLAATRAVEAQENANLAATREIEAKANAGLAATRAVEAQNSANLAATREIEARTNAALAVTRENEARESASLAATRQVEAEEQAGIALSRQLAAQSSIELDSGDFDQALLLAIESGRAHDTVEAFAALRRAMAQPRQDSMAFMGHTDTVEYASFDGNGDRLLTVGWFPTGREARIWSVATGKTLVDMAGLGEIRQADWSPDWSRVATVDSFRRAQIWDAETGEKLHEFSSTDPMSIREAGWNGDFSRLLTITSNRDRPVKIWDVASGELLAALDVTGTSPRAILNPDGSRVLTIGDDQTARIWNVGTGEELWALSTEPASSISDARWDEAGERVLLAFEDEIGVWDTVTGDRTLRLTTAGPQLARWSHDETQIATASSDGSVRIWDVAGGSERRVLTGHEGRIWDIAWSDDDSRLATAGRDARVLIWDPALGELLWTLDGYSSGDRVWWDRDMERLYAQERYTRDLRVWDGKGGRLLWELTLDDDHIVRLWDMSGARELPSAQAAEPEANLSCPIVTAGQLEGTRAIVRYLASNKGCTRSLYDHSSEGTLVWDWEDQTDAQLMRLGEKLKSVYGRWSPDGDQILTASPGGDVYLWDAEKGARRGSLHGHTGSVVFAIWNNDQSLLMTTSDDGTARTWDAHTGQPRLIIAGHQGAVIDAAWVPGEKLILTAGADHTVRVWDAVSGEEKMRLTGEPGQGTLADSVSRAGDRVFVREGDTTYQYYLAIGNLLEEACRRAPRNLSVSEWEGFMGDDDFHLTCPGRPAYPDG